MQVYRGAGGFVRPRLKALDAMPVVAVAVFLSHVCFTIAVPYSYAGYVNLALLPAAAVGIVTFAVRIHAFLHDTLRPYESVVQREERCRALIDVVSDWVWELNNQGRYTYVGPRTEDILGYAPHELLGQKPDILVRPDEWIRIKSILAPYVREAVPFPPFEAEVRHKSGRVLYVECAGVPIVNALGKVQGYRGADRDITPRKLAQKALRTSEMRLAEAQAVAHLGSGEWDITHNQISWSRGVYRILEVSPDQVQPSFDPYWRRIPESSRRSVLRSLIRTRTRKASSRFEHPLVFPDGREKCVQVRVRTILDTDGEPCRILGTIQDVTEQKELEKRLRDSEGRLRAAVEYMPNLFHAFDDTGRLVVWNREWEVVSGYSKLNMIGNPQGLSLLFPDNEQRMAFWNAWVGTADRGSDSTWDIVCADGNIRTVRWVNIGVKYPIAGWASWGVGKDITERRKIDAERNLLRAAIEQAVELVIIADTNGTVQYANPAFESITGYTRDEISGKQCHCFDKGSAGDSREHHAVLEQLQHGTPWQGRLESRRKDGTTFFEDVTMFPVKNENGAVTNIVRLGRDVTRETEFQAQLQQRQRLEALGTLAGGVAHDFNNLLMPIMGFTELMLDRMGASDTNRNYLEEILSASARARDIVRHMLAFSRQGPSECRPVHLKPTLIDALRLIRASIPSTVAIQENLETEQEMVWADPTQIHQILMNICTNAFQALQGRAGAIRVAADRVCATDSMETMHPALVSGQYYMRIRVADDGCGMDRETVERIFDPFFTTKPFGQGTGLGLATVHGIVTGLRGAVAVHSEPGKGTEFTVFLPEHMIQRRTEAPVQPQVPNGHGERILLVDDEDCVLEATQRLLGVLGYEVTATASSSEALDRVTSEPDRFDLMLTDQTMPAMTGAQLAVAVRSIRSDIPIVLTTGFSESILPESVHEIGFQRILRKPYSRQELAAVLRQALESPPETIG